MVLYTADIKIIFLSIILKVFKTSFFFLKLIFKTV